MKKGALFCLKGLIREPKHTKKGIGVLGILVRELQVRFGFAGARVRSETPLKVSRVHPQYGKG